MNRIEFMNRLSLLLSDIPENEREEAVQYYNDYLNDAGVESEEEVLKSLGTPEDLAASIRRGLLEGGAPEGEFSEKGYRENGCGIENEVACRQGSAEDERKEPSDGEAACDKGSANQADSSNFGNEPGKDVQRAEHPGTGNGGTCDSAKDDRGGERTHYDSARAGRAGHSDLDRRYRRGRGRSRSGGMNVLIVLLCILIAPVALPVLFSLALVAVILAAVLVLLVVIFLFTGIICIVAGVISLFGAIADLVAFPAGAVMAAGMSLMTIGFGVLLTLGISWVLSKAFPKAFRNAVDFCSGLFRKKGGHEV